ncbi:MAG: pyridoxal phosphate-dependent aminotransferase [Negativicutes bacterium]|nr:pyridoxal phosphate-dependent aminotransferase [Negativicutes bacterium]
MNLVADKMKEIPFAGIRRVFEKAGRLEAQGQKIIHFEIGRPDFDTPAHIKESAKAALDKGFVHYTANNGLPALREALAMRLKTDKGLTYDPDRELIATAGGQEALYLGLLSILNPGDEVLIPDPCFQPFTLIVRLSGGVPVNVPLQADNHFAFDLAAAKKALTSRTKAIIVNSPHNPTGAVLTEAQTRELAAFAVEHRLLLISDDAYDRMVYNGRFVSPAVFPGMKDRTIICGSLSKTYAMTGWRVGYLAAPEAVIDAAHRLQQNILISLNTFAQYGAVTALTESQACVDDMMTQFDRRRRLVLDMIDSIPGLDLENSPQGAFYVFPRITLPDLTSAQVADYLLDNAGVAAVDGSSFGEGGNGRLRISYATSYEDCQEGLERIHRAMEQLAK